MKLSIEKITEGKKIASEIAKGNTNFRKSVLEGTSVDVRLGKFLMELDVIANQNGLKGKKKSPLLQQAGVEKIAKQRRSDAFVLAKNLEEIQEWIKSTSWKNGNSTSSLLRDWRIAMKTESSDAPKKPTASDESEKTKSFDTSNGKAVKISPKSLEAADLAKLVLTVAKNDKVVLEMMAQLEATLQRREAAKAAQSNVVAMTAVAN